MRSSWNKSRGRRCRAGWQAAAAEALRGRAKETSNSNSKCSSTRLLSRCNSSRGTNDERTRINSLQPMPHFLYKNTAATSVHREARSNSAHTVSGKSHARWSDQRRRPHMVGGDALHSRRLTRPAGTWTPAARRGRRGLARDAIALDHGAQRILRTVIPGILPVR